VRRGPAARDVQRMFGRIAGRYDRLNRLISFGMDSGWRREAARLAGPARMRVLDLGAGTGDLSRALLDAGAARVVAADLTPAMLRRAPSGPRLVPVLADALRLPFRDASFDRVASAFLLRNVEDVGAALAETARVLRPGGIAVCLEMTPPPRTLFGAIFRLYFRRVMPLVAGLLSDRGAYRYLPASVEGFPDADALAAIMRDAGLRDVRYRRLAGGTVALHRGICA